MSRFVPVRDSFDRESEEPIEREFVHELISLNRMRSASARGFQLRI